MVIEIKSKDLIATSICQKNTHGKSNQNILQNGEVVDVDPNNRYIKKPDFFVIQDENGKAEEGQQMKQEFYVTPLLGDYLNHWLQIISLDYDSDQGSEQESDGKVKMYCTYI